MAAKYRILKYNGNDPFSFAVFRSKDTKGINGIVFYGQANPIVCGLSKQEALYHKRSLEKKYAD